MSHCIMVQKNFKMWEAGPVLAEQQRRLKYYKSHNIDGEKTKENIPLIRAYNPDIASVRLPQYICNYKESQNIGGRFNIDKVKNAKNGTNVMCQTVFTASHDFFESRSREEGIKYFNTCLRFLEMSYPNIHILSADIHFDESNPHLHIAWLPIYLDRATGKKSFNQKKLQPGKEYFKEYQQSFYNFMIYAGYDFEEFEHGKQYLDLEEYRKKMQAEKQLLTIDPVQPIEYEEQLFSRKVVSASRESILTANEQLQRLEVLERENRVLQEENTRLQREKEHLKSIQKMYYELLVKFRHLENELKRALEFINSLGIKYRVKHREEKNIPREKI